MANRRSRGHACPQELANYIRDNASEGNQWENFTSNKLVDVADEELLRQYVGKAKAAGRISVLPRRQGRHYRYRRR